MDQIGRSLASRACNGTPACAEGRQVGFVHGEAVSQRLMGGKVHGKTVFKWLLEDVQQKLGKSVCIIRVDSGYLSADILDYAVSSDMQICMAARYDWVLAQGIKLSANLWEQIDETTKLYDVGKTRVISTTQKQFRVVLVEKKQTPFPGSKSKKKILRYAIIENFKISVKEAIINSNMR